MHIKIFLVLCFLFIAFLETGCLRQKEQTLKEQVITEAGKEEVSEFNFWDFGQVKEDEVLKHGFTLKNESKKTLNIKDVNTSCSCTVSEVKKKILLPQEEALIEVQFKAKGYSGPVEQYIYVHTDNLDNPIIRFIIKANVVK